MAYSTPFTKVKLYSLRHMMLKPACKKPISKNPAPVKKESKGISESSEVFKQSLSPCPGYACIVICILFFLVWEVM